MMSRSWMAMLNALVDARRRHRISQRDLAARLGVTCRTIRRWGEGLTFPRVETMDAWANELGLELWVSTGQADSMTSTLAGKGRAA